MFPALQLLLTIAGTYLLPPSYAARYRVWDEAGEPIALVAYSFAVPQAAPAGDTLLVRLALHQRDSTGLVHFDSTFRAAGSRISDHETHFSGLLQLPRTDTLTHWRLAATVAGGDSALVVGTGSQLPAGASDLELSDLIFGARAGSAPWVHGMERTPVSVTAEFDRRDTVQLAFQARSAIPRTRVRTTITVTDVTDPRHGHRVLAVSSDGVVRPGVNDFERDLDVSHLRPGEYLVELQISDLGHGGGVVRPATFTLRR